MKKEVRCYRGKCGGLVTYHESSCKYSCQRCLRIYSEQEIKYLSRVTLRMLKKVTI